MKRINFIILGSIVLYLFLAILTWFTITKTDTKDNAAYRVEVNRIMNDLQYPFESNDFKNNHYSYVQDISFLEKDKTNQSEVESFYLEDNYNRITIQPWYVENEFVGYVKFIYVPTLNLNHLFMMLEGGLLLVEVILLLLFWYFKKHIIKPFDQIQEIPILLAKGHYKNDVIVQKSKYMNTYLLGLGQLKDSLETSKKRQLDLEKEKKQLLLSLSHDIKTPLNLIKLYGKALEENVYTDRDNQIQAIHQIGEKASEIEQYVERIITSSREDILDLQVTQSEFYLNDLMEKVLSVYRPQCERRFISLTVKPYENRILKGDIERSQEVFENLFENIFKYGDGRTIEISFYEEEYCQLIRIYNSGEVINDNEFNHIFDSFFRASNSKGKAGSGLGLYICRELMQKMDGTIFAQKCEDGMAFVLVFR